MMEDPKTGNLRPFDFAHLSEQIPELKKFDLDISAISFERPIDSSNMNPKVWVQLVEIIKSNYKKFDGFVILHGSDTMAFTASALSFMLENLDKPVVLTGSQLPIGTIRTDGKENLITALEIAGAKENGKAIVPEVCIYFEYRLYRGNRTYKDNAEHFQAFRSPNYPELAEAGVHLKYNKEHIRKLTGKNLKVHTQLDTSIAILKLYPGINQNFVSAVLKSKGLKGVILETFGSGNAPMEQWFIEQLSEAIKKDIAVINVTQCRAGRVEQGRYETSSLLKKIGVISGSDITSEAAVTKLMFLLGKGISGEQLKTAFEKSLCGEMSI